MKVEDVLKRIRQLTIGEIQDILDDEAREIENKEWTPDILTLLFPGRIPSKGILKSLDLEMCDLKKFNPEDLSKIIEGVESKNPYFAQMASRLGEMAKTI